MNKIQYSNITAVLDHLSQLLILPPTMYCTVQGGESTDATSVNYSLIYICGTFLSTTLLMYKSVGQPSVTSVIHRNCQQPLTTIRKSSVFKVHPQCRAEYPHSQQSLLKFLQLHLLNLYISRCYFWT